MHHEYSTVQARYSWGPRLGIVHLRAQGTPVSEVRQPYRAMHANLVLRMSLAESYSVVGFSVAAGASWCLRST